MCFNVEQRNFEKLTEFSLTFGLRGRFPGHPLGINFRLARNTQTGFERKEWRKGKVRDSKSLVFFQGQRKSLAAGKLLIKACYSIKDLIENVDLEKLLPFVSC